MKKHLLLLLAGLMLTSCNNSGNNTEDDYKTVTFHYNYEMENDVYLSLRIYEGQKLLEPTTVPTREDYYFSGWFSDTESSVEFEGFGDYVTENLDIYASWGLYSELSDVEKIDKFIEKIKSLEGLVSNAYMTQSAMLTYYVVNPPQQLQFYEERDYHRYNDITTIDYYDEGKTNNFAQEQFFYDESYFYDLYKDIEGNGENNYKESARFTQREVNPFLDITFSNMNLSLLEDVSTDLKNGATSDEVEYEFNFDFTKVNEYAQTYTFDFYCAFYTYSENLGAWSSEIHALKCGLTFENGKIKGSKVINQYLNYLGEDPMMALETTSETEYTYTDSYQEFSGVKFNPADFDES